VVSDIWCIFISGICGMLLALGLWVQARIAVGQFRRRAFVGLKYLSIIAFFGVHWFAPGRLILDALIWISSAVACLLMVWLIRKWSE